MHFQVVTWLHNNFLNVLCARLAKSQQKHVTFCNSMYKASELQYTRSTTMKQLLTWIFLAAVRALRSSLRAAMPL